MNKKYSFKNALILLITSVLLITCKPNTEFTPAPTKVILTVIGLDGVTPQPNAKVVLFDNKTKFLSQNYSFGTTGNVGIDSTNDKGEVTFDNLDPNVNYYVMAYTIDSKSFEKEGYVIYNDNSNTGFEFFQKLNISSITRANVYLQPAEAIISFYADSSIINVPKVSVVVFLDNNPIGTITGFKDKDSVEINKANQPVLNNVITKKVRIGARPLAVSYLNQMDCLNIGAGQAIEPGKFNKVNVNVCDNGKVIFTAIDRNVKIDIELERNPIGSLNVDGVTSIGKSLEPRRYNYTATNGKCIWSNSFTIKSDSVSIVNLLPCN